MPLFCYVCGLLKEESEFACPDTCKTCMSMQVEGNRVVDEHFWEILDLSEPIEEQMHKYSEKLFFLPDPDKIGFGRSQVETDLIHLRGEQYQLHKLECAATTNPLVDNAVGRQCLLPAQIIAAGNNVLDRVLAIREGYSNTVGDVQECVVGIYYWDVFLDDMQNGVGGVQAGVYYVPKSRIIDLYTLHSAITIGLATS